MTRDWFSIAAASIFATVLAARAAAQDDEPRAQEQGKPAAEVYRNIQVLKDVPASEIQAAMTFMSSALGVRCDHCHSRGFDRDDKPAKKSARQMIQMMQQLNEDHFDGELRITCYTCHHGQVEPASAAAVREPSATIGDLFPEQRPPRAEDVLAKYVAAIGGADAVAKVAAVALRGSAPSERGGNVPFEVVVARPGKVWRSDGSGDRAMIRGFDGTSAWQVQPGRAQGRGRGMNGERLATLRMDADVISNLDLASQLDELRVAGRQRVLGHDAYVVTAVPKDGALGTLTVDREQLFFDAKSGLLLRRVREIHTVLGPLPMATDYDDYRAVGGVQLPFKRRIASGREDQSVQVDAFTLNPEIPPGKFTRPAAGG